MNSSVKLLFRETVCICLLAVIIGVVWNHKLLYRAWTGTAAPPALPAGAAAPAAIPLPVGLMQVKDFFDRKEGVIIDARDTASFAKGRISGAVSLPVGEADAKLAEFKKKHPPSTMLIVYCNGYSCHDSAELGNKLIQAGYQSVFIFEGGYPEWKDAGHPVEGSEP